MVTTFSAQWGCNEGLFLLWSHSSCHCCLRIVAAMGAFLVRWAHPEVLKRCNSNKAHAKMKRNQIQGGSRTATTKKKQTQPSGTEELPENGTHGSHNAQTTMTTAM